MTDLWLVYEVVTVVHFEWIDLDSYLIPAVVCEFLQVIYVYVCTFHVAVNVFR